MIDKTIHRLRRVVPTLPPTVIDEAEHQLADLARHRTPRQLGEAAHEILRHHDPDGEAPHDTDRPAEELRMHTARDGTLTGRFRFAEPDAADTIRSAIEARTPPPEPDADTTPLRPGRELHKRRAEALRALVDDAGTSHEPGEGDTDSTDDRDHADRADPDLADLADLGDLGDLGDLADLADPHLCDTNEASSTEASSTGEHPAQTSTASTTPQRPGRDRPNRETTMIVTIPLDVLTGATRRRDDTDPRRRQGPTQQGLGLLDGRWTLSPEASRRLACDAAVIPAVLGTRGEILDLGRKTRVVSTAQRRAVIARDRHCAHPGCRLSPRRCDVHHIVPWYLGGRTDLLNLVLLYPYHHHQIHHSGWQIHIRDGVPAFIPPAWLDPPAHTPHQPSGTRAGRVRPIHRTSQRYRDLLARR